MCFSYIWLPSLSITILRFIHAVACILNSIPWIHLSLSTHLLTDSSSFFFLLQIKLL